MDFKQRQCLQTQRNVPPENVTGTNTSAAAMIKIARTYSTAVVQRLHTALVASSNLAMSTTKNIGLLLQAKHCIINVLAATTLVQPTDSEICTCCCC